MAKTILILLIIGLITSFVVNLFFTNKDSNITKVQIGDPPAGEAGNIWNVEVVSSLNDRTKGLSNRKSLERNTGMLFVFGEEDNRAIWMKDMLFAIDIIWIDEELRIVGIKKGAAPESYPEVFRSELPALYILEINAGEVLKAEIEIGDMVKIIRNSP